MFFIFQDPVGQIEQLDQFLGYNRGRELCEQIADACSFTKMKLAKDENLAKPLKKSIFKENDAAFFRKGDSLSVDRSDCSTFFTVPA